MDATFGTVTVTRGGEGHIARLTFDGGHPHNVLTSAMLDDIRAGLEDVTNNPPRVLVLAGRTENFSRGAALEEIVAMGDEFRTYIAREFDLFSAVEALPFVTIAAMTGLTIGNAAELALACDFRIAAERARFTLPEVAIGFVAPAQRISRILGMAAAKDFLLGSRMWSADEALKHGVFTKVLPEAEFEAGLAAFAAEFAAKAPLAVRLTKEGIAKAYGFASADYEGEKTAAWDTYCSEDAKEGFAAIREKRPPVFRGS
jgi:enoyl-CoA hydratase/carnithine racemase